MKSKVSFVPIVMLGGGGHASVLVDILRLQGREILAVVSPDDLSLRKVFEGLKHLSKDEDVLQYKVEDVLLVNGIGALPGSNVRFKVGQYFSGLGYRFETIVSPHAIISPYAELAEGVQVLHGAIVQSGVTIAQHSIINTKALVEHDCRIGRYNHLAPGAVLCGQVVTQQQAYIGAGATVIQNLTLGQQCTVAAGATVVRDLANNSTVYPRRPTVKKESQ